MSTLDAEFAKMYEAHSRQIYAYCRRRADPETASDALSEIFLVAWRRFAAVPKGRDQLLWLYGVAYRILSQQRRSFRRMQRLERKLLGAGSSLWDAPDYVIVLREEAETALEAAERLNPKDPEVLRLAIWEELSHAEIAEVLGSAKELSSRGSTEPDRT